MCRTGVLHAYSILSTRAEEATRKAKGEAFTPVHINSYRTYARQPPSPLALSHQLSARVQASSAAYEECEESAESLGKSQPHS